MIIPNVMLGGIPIVIHGGAPQCQYQAVDGGVERLRLSGGAAVQMTHWRKTAITISGSGWIGTGMLGLDFDSPLELRCNASLGVSGRTAADRVFTIPGEVRPDAGPWGLALVGREWVRTDVSSAGQVVTVSEIPGAQLYRVEWWPLFHVFASIPPEALDSSNNSRTWQIVAEEI
ncbi:hypothetical protein [Pseudomonas aeruginosa]|uniref:hypothetical protein n=1 Tax=Pseudomonas aeruginosa TaxID=287 RepID=UPI000EAE84C6|nr:hypothetical protein [Pseudomonas aeruginosa]ELL4435625.1 hypothetical protein [Pseudomonas aeruginosa]MBH9092306.1 hypothetical protein [Pseudomonas aeruginosa]MBX6039023.1 hypothetical protein [Pseudomonas aeruginosa]MBX6570603.1 hypothetical protein [Pseudomonas aeruginosa]MBX6651160.1 hypothetical protein [Pseudomonas aeruginosa]